MRICASFIISHHTSKTTVILFLSLKQELLVGIIIHAEIFKPVIFVVIRAINLFDELKKGNFVV